MPETVARHREDLSPSEGEAPSCFRTLRRKRRRVLRRFRDALLQGAHHHFLRFGHRGFKVGVARVKFLEPGESAEIVGTPVVFSKVSPAAVRADTHITPKGCGNEVLADNSSITSTTAAPALTTIDSAVGGGRRRR